MNKPAVVLLGFVVAVGVVSAGGAWYTGKQLEPVLQTAIQNANKELQTSMAGVDGSVSLELVSLDRGVFSSTAHYRLKGQGSVFGEQNPNPELLFVDHIEHGPLPFSRLVSLKWLPVMATSHYALEKNATTEQWFAASKDVSPLKGVANIGYSRSVSGNVELLPLEFKDDKSSVSFSGANLDFDSSAEGQKVKADGYMNSLKVAAVDANGDAFEAELAGLTVASNLAKSTFGFYTGQNTIELTDTKVTFGPQKAVLTLKGFEQKDSSETKDNNLAGRVDYKIDEIGYQGKPVGSAAMAVSMKNVDIPAMLVLTKLYQDKMQPVQAAAAAGQPAPELQLTEAEQTLAEANVNQVLAAKPQLAVENLSLKTTHGESKFSLVLDLAKPASMELPPVELGKQMISLLDANLSLSKPMIGDVAALQAQVGGVTDPKAIEQQSQMAADMVSGVAVGTQLATLEGTDVVSKLHYANNEVTFNGQKMTVEQFISFVMSKAGAMSGAQ
ncbi:MULTISPECIES: YdgA family protein [unclassified Pseudomonas]|uniref:YdgA family protein n=1 Tax=unclassified Pseudomonas TaxID=196821 RepID=UPI000F55C7AE|nr:MULTISPECIES: YdgA family protein [unclassified Pseudomonas]AZF08395.1 GTP-binding protein [Pseudomonas sp. R2-37-08W]AZF13675.1 GTP-binding protein [Pseudomonas sp. R3-18-08]